MNFTQYNKINSAPPPSKNCTERHLRNYDSRGFQSTNFLYQPQMPVTQHHHQQPKPMMHQSYAYSLPATATMSANCGDQCYPTSVPLSTATTTTPDEVDEFDIEYFQCTPPVKSSSKGVNPFRPIIESMRRFTPNQRPSHGVGDTVNHQTYICSHNDENDCCTEESVNCEREEVINKCYKSFTKIISIPNGVKIITEIKKEDNCGKTDCIECSKKLNKIDENWMNKQIEVTLDESDQNQGNDDGGNLN